MLRINHVPEAPRAERTGLDSLNFEAGQFLREAFSGFWTAVGCGTGPTNRVRKFGALQGFPVLLFFPRALCAQVTLLLFCCLGGYGHWSRMKQRGLGLRSEGPVIE